MLTTKTRDLIETACEAVAREGHTMVGVVVSDNDEEVQPFSNLPTTAEFVYNMLSGAGLIADTIGADIKSIVAAQEDFQKQFIKINEA